MKTKILILLIAVIVLGIGGFFTYKNLNQPNQSEKTGDNGQERNFVALGASFTKANNLSSSMVGDNPEYSFATGTKIESVYLYLEERGENLEPKNLAESGADSQKVLTQQVPNTISFQPKYVTIDIMADIFEEEQPIKFKQNLIEIAKQIKNQDNTVFIGNYPNLTLMRKTAYPACLEDKLHIGINKVTEEKLKLFNKTIEDVAKSYDLILVDNFDTLGPKEVSDYDCLHPNIEGQEKLAQKWINALEARR